MIKRKFFGTIIGLIFWSVCIIFFTYAYYDWKSDPTNVVLGIEDLSVECLVGANVSATNIGPVLDYQDGVKAEFSVKNPMVESMAIELRLDITEGTSNNLLTESLKYVVVTNNGVVDEDSKPVYDYNNPIKEGDFSNFIIGNNTIAKALEVSSEITTNYQFIIYIDGNMYNNPNMQENSINANLMIGNCSEDAVTMDEMIYQAIYSDSDNSLTFIQDKLLKVGDTYNGKPVTAVYTGFETASYGETQVPWYSIRSAVTTVNFEDEVKPISTRYWFNGFSNLNNIDIYKLNTSEVTNMYGMFQNCNGLTELDVSHFDTSKTTNMYGMFNGCSSLTELDVSNFDTSNVTNFTATFSGCNSLLELDVSNFNTSKGVLMHQMFTNCSSLVELDVSNFDTSNVTNMNNMFSGCSLLLELDVSNFNTSSVEDMSQMFRGCGSLTSLDLSNFNTSSVTTMVLMFNACSKLVSLDISNFNLANVTDMTGMFADANQLSTVIVNDFNISNVATLTNMFYHASAITITITISNPNITEYGEMFTQAGKITVNYTPETATLVNDIIGNYNSNIVMGKCIGTNCPAEET